MDEREQESWHLNGETEKKVEEEDKKVWKAHINEDNHRQEKAIW